MIDLKKFNYQDNQGNKLEVIDLDGKLRLTLFSDPKNKEFRYIGTLKKGKQTYYYEKKEPEKDRWGVHYHILYNLPDDGGMVFITEKGRYIIKKETALKHGQFLHFKKTGLEKRIFIPVKYWSFYEKC